MHFQVLVEDQSGKKALDILIPKFIGSGYTFDVKLYKGIGRIPKKPITKSDPQKRILLDQLPRLLQGYGKSFLKSKYEAFVIIVCDLDNRCLESFRQELLAIIADCNPKPTTKLCFAIEEVEAWLLGDTQAILKAYPKAKKKLLEDYRPDSIGNTWERLADAVYPGGAQALQKEGFSKIGHEKSKWAQNIAPYIDPEQNRSPSLQYFRDKMLEYL